MYQQQQYTSLEDQFKYWVRRLGSGQPNCGKTYVMYHGTDMANAPAIMRDGFHQSSDGMLGRGVYLSRDLNKASRYPLDVPASQRVVFRVRVNVGNVIAINYQGHPRQRNWYDGRYGEVFDAAWCPPNCGITKSGLEEDCVWDPRRITIDEMITPRPQMDREPLYTWEDVDQPSQLGSTEPNDGETYVMYHGTRRANAKAIMREGFHQSTDGVLGRGVYLSGDLIEASRYPLDVAESQRVVFRVRVNVGKVIVINHHGHNTRSKKNWHDAQCGEVFDTAWCPPDWGMSSMLEICVWDPKRIFIERVITPTH